MKLFFPLCLFLVACQPRSFQTQKWSAAEGPLPAWAQTQDFVGSDKPLQVGDELIFRSHQSSHGLIIDHSQRTLIQKQGTPIWASQISVKSPLKLLSRAEVMAYRLRANAVEERLRGDLLREGYEINQSPELIIRSLNGEFRPVLKMLVTRPQTGEFFEQIYQLSGELIDSRAVGVGAVADPTTPARLFPLGPKKSQLAWVNLEVPEKFLGLKNSMISIKSQSGLHAKPQSESLSYPLEDPRFDQVQVFYYADRFLKILQERHQFLLPSPLQIETHIGFPESSNAAFYFRSVIRFGTGDGVSFRDLMRDPTIVSHEVGHAVIDALAELPFEGEGGSINEGLADFFSASILNTPLMGESSFLKAPFKRNLLNTKSFLDRQNKMYADSEIISGLFWQIRIQLGAEKAERLALRVLPRLLPGVNLDQFRDEMFALTSALPADDQAIMEAIYKQRQWK